MLGRLRFWQSDPPRLWRVAALAAGVVVLAAVFLMLFEASHHAVVGNSDGATVALEGAAIDHGNLALSGWTLSFDSFWTLDVIAYALADALIGLRMDLLNAIPALIAVGVVAVGLLLATRGQAGGRRLIAAAVLVALVALPNHALAEFLLQGPWHVGTTLGCLAAFALVLRPTWWRYSLAVLLLATGLLGDLQTLLLGVVPLAVVGVLVAIRHRNWRAGAPTFSVAPVAVAAALVIRRIALAAGTFQIENQKQTAPISHLGSNLGYLVRWGSALFGVGTGTYGSGGVPASLRLAYVAGFVVVLAAVAATIVAAASGTIRPRPSARVGRAEDDWRLDTLLLVAAACSVVTFLALTRSDNVTYARYLTAGVIYAGILTARRVASALPALRGRLRPFAAVLGAAVIACYGAAFGFTLAQPRPVQPVHTLTKFLESHHLRNGIGEYWAASIVTLDSGGKVHVRPINADLKGILVRYQRQSRSGWYRNQLFDFVVYQPSLPYGRVTPASITRTFGTPSHTYFVGQYAVDIYSTPFQLSAAGFPPP